MFDRAQYTSYANDTRWSELRQAMVAVYPRAPRFRVQILNGCSAQHWDGEWYYHFRSDYEWKNMEWVDLAPTTTADAVSTDQIELICRRIGFEIERHENFVRVIGYRRMS